MKDKTRRTDERASDLVELRPRERVLLPIQVRKQKSSRAVPLLLVGVGAGAAILIGALAFRDADDEQESGGGGGGGSAHVSGVHGYGSSGAGRPAGNPRGGFGFFGRGAGG